MYIQICVYIYISLHIYIAFRTDTSTTLLRPPFLDEAEECYIFDATGTAIRACDNAPSLSSIVPVNSIINATANVEST